MQLVIAFLQSIVASLNRTLHHKSKHFYTNVRNVIIWDYQGVPYGTKFWKFIFRATSLRQTQNNSIKETIPIPRTRPRRPPTVEK